MWSWEAVMVAKPLKRMEIDWLASAHKHKNKSCIKYRILTFRAHENGHNLFALSWDETKRIQHNIWCWGFRILVSGRGFAIFSITMFMWCRPKIEGNWSFRCTSGVSHVDVGTGRSCRWRGVVYLLLVPEILAVMVTIMGGTMISRALIFGHERPTCWVSDGLSRERVTLKTLGSPLRHIFRRCIHV